MSKYMDYFVRREMPPASFEEDYWRGKADPDGVVRDKTQEMEQAQEDMALEIRFFNAMQPGTILDVGCGLGHFLAAIDSKHDKHGVEVSKFAAKMARKHGQIHEGPLESHHFTAGLFDGVFCHHVIEHLDDPLSLVREINRIVRPGGYFLVGTPDFDSPCAKVFGDRYRLLHDPTHISLFTRVSLHNMLADCGFTVMDTHVPFIETRHFTSENVMRMLEGEGVSPPWQGNVFTHIAVKEKEWTSLV